MNLTNRSVTPKNAKRKSHKENDRAFLDWLKTQKSALSGQSPCDPCHYRTAKNSGVGCKPLFSAIPLTRDEHSRQHQVGQFNFMPRIWWEKMTDFYLQEWKKTLIIQNDVK